MSLCCLLFSVLGSDAAEFSVVPGENSLLIRFGETDLATYHFRHEKISRPFFANLRAADGTLLSRNFPPVPGEDRTDHDTMHPGLWLAFGDLNGCDFWRNKNRVEHLRFVVPPTVGKDSLRLTVRNRYLGNGERGEEPTICEEECRLKFVRHPQGILLLWDSKFEAMERAFAFGDQEEMGLGIRVATPLSVSVKGAKPPAETVARGTIRDQLSRKNEKEIWGNAALWCDYGGTIDGKSMGMTIFDHPENFRPAWLHARDYGVVVANPFGREAFGKGEKSKIEISPGETFRLRYGILLHSEKASEPLDLDQVRNDYLKLTEKND